MPRTVSSPGLKSHGFCGRRGFQEGQLSERITVENGQVLESNFYDYFVPRMKDVPNIHVDLIVTPNDPTGAGQMAVPNVAPAIANAVAAATGVRLRHIPMTPQRVLAALETQ